jgi:hypothetical protein
MGNRMINAKPDINVKWDNGPMSIKRVLAPHCTIRWTGPQHDERHSCP